MTEFDIEFNKLQAEYAAKFGEGFSLYMANSEDVANPLEAMKRCIESNTPYHYQLPEGCIA